MKQGALVFMMTFNLITGHTMHQNTNRRLQSNMLCFDVMISG